MYKMAGLKRVKRLIEYPKVRARKISIRLERVDQKTLDEKVGTIKNSLTVPVSIARQNKRKVNSAVKRTRNKMMIRSNQNKIISSSATAIQEFEMVETLKKINEPTDANNQILSVFEELLKIQKRCLQENKRMANILEEANRLKKYELGRDPDKPFRLKFVELN